MKMHLVIAMYNVSNAVERNIRVVKSQTFTAFQCILIDDISTDDTVERARAAIDGDDQLADENSLQIVADTYARDDCWMTYGSYRSPDGERDPICRPYADEVIDTNGYRKTRWLASHLKTFKYKLWKKLDAGVFQVTEDECRKARRRALSQLRIRAWWNWRHVRVDDLHDATGRYIRRVDDKAFTFAMLEMAGRRVSFIENILYIYHSQRLGGAPDQNYGADKSEKWHTRMVRDVLENQEPYARLEEL